MRETRSNKWQNIKSPKTAKPSAGLSGAEAAAHEVRKMSRAVRIRGDDLETKRKPKKRNLAEEHSTSPSHPEILFAIFEPDKAQSEAKRDGVYDMVEPVTEEPYIPDELADNPDTLAAKEHANAKYQSEKYRRANLFTMKHHSDEAPSSLFVPHRLLPISEPAKNAVLLAAKSVILLSSFLGPKPLNKCSGLWFQRDNQSKTSLVLTSPHLIREKDGKKWKWQWTGKYYPEAEVFVQLDNKAAPGRLVYLQEHYEFAIYEFKVDKPVQLPTFNDSVRSGQDVFRLGRDENLDLRITHGMVAYEIPSWYERCHYMYFSRDPSSRRLLHDDGGPIIDLEGKVVGLVNNHINETFVPSSILHKCLDFWRNFRYVFPPFLVNSFCMPRLHLGMTFTSVEHLDPISTERMSRNHSIESGLIVEQVSKGSHAEEIGIRVGDIIESFNGKYISTTVELEKMLIDICWDHFDQGNDLYAEKDVSVKIFDAVELRQKTRKLAVIVSNLGEDIVESSRTII